MKNIFFLFLLIAHSHAGEGEIIVLETPLFKEPDVHSKILDRYRKGKTIYIHSQHFKNSPHERQYDDYTDIYERNIGQGEDQEIGKIENELISITDEYSQTLLTPDEQDVAFGKSQFFLTTDKNGQDAYILKDHVKLITKDNRELNNMIGDYFVNDPTDYRLKEPIGDTYPFKRKETFNVQLHLGSGNLSREQYDFVENVSTIDNKYKITTNFILQKNFANDQNKRSYWGGQVYFDLALREFNLSAENQSILLAKESMSQFGFGPYFSYDVFRLEKSKINIFASPMLIYHQRVVIQYNRFEEFEEKKFKGFSAAANLGASHHWQKIFPHLDGLIGTSILLNLPNKLTSNNSGSINYWNNQVKDQYKNSLSAEFNLFLGLQANY